MDIQDPETQGLLARWAGVAVSTVIATLGLQRWHAKRKASMDARFDSKASMKEVDDIHHRIARHKKATEEQVARNYNAIIDLYAKHEVTQTKILEAEQRSSDRFEKLMTAIGKL